MMSFFVYFRTVGLSEKLVVAAFMAAFVIKFRRHKAIRALTDSEGLTILENFTNL